MATYLQRAVDKRGIEGATLAREMGYKSKAIADFWLGGWKLPSETEFRRLADVLDLDVRTLAIGTMIERNPTLDHELRSLLHLAGLSFPAHSDPDLIKLPAAMPERPGATIPPPRRRLVIPPPERGEKPGE